MLANEDARRHRPKMKNSTLRCYFDGRENVRRALRDDPVRYIKNIPSRFLFDREIVEWALHHVCYFHESRRYSADGMAQVVKYIPRSFLRDLDFLESMLGPHPCLINFLEDDVTRDKKFLHRMAMASSGRIFNHYEYDETEVWVDGFFKALIPECGLALGYASTTLRGDKEVVRAAVAVRDHGDAIASACEQVIDLDLCVLAAQNGASKESLPLAFRNEPDVVLGMAEYCCRDIDSEAWHLLEDRDFVAKISRVATCNNYLDVLLPLHMRHDPALLVQRRVDEIGYLEYAELLRHLEKESSQLLKFGWSMNTNYNVIRHDQIADCLPYAAASLDRERKRLAEQEGTTRKKRKKALSAVEKLTERVEKLAKFVLRPHHPLKKMSTESVPFVGDVSETSGGTP